MLSQIEILILGVLLSATSSWADGPVAPCVGGHGSCGYSAPTPTVVTAAPSVALNRGGQASPFLTLPNSNSGSAPNSGQTNPYGIGNGANSPASSSRPSSSYLADRSYSSSRSSGGSESFELGPAAPKACMPSGSAVSPWDSAESVLKERVIPPGGGYDIASQNWPKLRRRGDKFAVEFNGQTSMCTSATAAAFTKHISDLCNSEKLDCSDDLLKTINGPIVRNALNGNTWSFAALNAALGGQNMIGKGASVITVLKQARPGDVMKFDRSSGTGHSTIFKEIDGNKVCFWSSNTSTNGVGVKCEPLSQIVDVAVSRLPNDPAKLIANIEHLKESAPVSLMTPNNANRMPSGAVRWDSKLECPSETDHSVPDADKKDGAIR